MEYILYGDNIIENDSTLRDFTKSVLKQIGEPEFLITDENGEELAEDYISNVDAFLKDDLSRTNPDYIALATNFAPAAGLVLADADNWNLYLPQVDFYGPGNKEFVEFLVRTYIDMALFHTEDELCAIDYKGGNQE